MLSRGLRRGEVCGLRWSDVHLDAGRLSIVQTHVVVSQKVVVSEPKTAAGRRSVPLDAELVRILRAHRARQIEERLLAGPSWEDSGLVFVNQLGMGLRPQYLSRRVRTLTLQAGLRPIRLHDLRHSAASMMLADGTPVKVVSEMIGHSDPAITMGVYQHVIPAMGEVAGERLTRLLGGRSG
jgi:integrase